MHISLGAKNPYWSVRNILYNTNTFFMNRLLKYLITWYYVFPGHLHHQFPSILTDFPNLYLHFIEKSLTRSLALGMLLEKINLLGMGLIYQAKHFSPFKFCYTFEFFEYIFDFLFSFFLLSCAFPTPGLALDLTVYHVI